MVLTNGIFRKVSCAIIIRASYLLQKFQFCFKMNMHVVIVFRPSLNYRLQFPCILILRVDLDE